MEGDLGSWAELILTRRMQLWEAFLPSVPALPLSITCTHFVLPAGCTSSCAWGVTPYLVEKESWTTGPLSPDDTSLLFKCCIISLPSPWDSSHPTQFTKAQLLHIIHFCPHFICFLNILISIYDSCWSIYFFLMKKMSEVGTTLPSPFWPPYQNAQKWWIW